MSKTTLIALCLAVFSATAEAETSAFRLESNAMVGAWESAQGRYYLTQWGDETYLIRSRDGKAWTLAQRKQEKNIFDVLGLDGSEKQSRLELTSADGWRVGPAGSILASATRVLIPSEEFVAKNGEEAELHGTVLWPRDSQPKATIIYLNGEGPNSRTDVLPTALALLDSGFAAVVFDQRHAGESTGAKNEGSYFERSLRAAEDAKAVSEWITRQARFRRFPVGVVGWSQGGWIGAIVARENPDLDFYVNIAGSISRGWLQWRHSMISRLTRSGIESTELTRAITYFDAFFGVMNEQISWQEYLDALAAAREEPWWPVMKRRNVAEWESQDEVREFASRELSQDPADDLRQIAVPALGVFFEFDGSTTPEAPGVFATALSASPSRSFSVVQLPGLQHGSWKVESYADSAARFSTRSQDVHSVIANWLERFVLPSDPDARP